MPTRTPSPLRSAGDRAVPRRTRPRRALALLSALLGFGAAGETAETSPSIGLPISRTYSIEEIGSARGPNLNFDRLGRLAVISGGSYIVLNDNAWIDLAVHGNSILPILELALDARGNAYYGALASWGRAETTPDGRILPVSLRPETYPAWVNSTNFTQIILTESGVLFVGTNGVVHLDAETGRQTFTEIPVATAFTLGGHAYVSSGIYGTARLDPTTGETVIVDPDVGVFETAAFGPNALICATIANRLVTFDGQRFEEPDLGFKDRSPGSISCLESLPDGGFALSIDSEGLFLFSENGEQRMALTTSDYRRIYDIAAREPGTLWLARESSVEKLLYNNPVSVVDQRSDVVIGWPQVVQSEGESLIASNGRLYRMAPSEDGWNYAFHEFEDVPESGAWAIAANPEHLLIGNSNGVYARRDGAFRPILVNFDANRLFLQEADLCLVVGSNQIAALRWDGSQWSECAPRIDGVGFPSVAHPTDSALWIELGLDRVARVWFEDGRLRLDVIDQFPWDEPVWINIGILDHSVVLSGAHNQRIYLDKRSANPLPAPPAIESALAQAPDTILRVSEDANGVIWATHPTGVVTFHPQDDGYRIDVDSLASIKDQYPVITLVNGEHAWISTESALYHVDQDFVPRPASHRQPFLVSVADGKTGQLLFAAARDTPPLGKLDYSQNHLVFRYFSGGYDPLQAPAYAFSMQQGSESWTVQSEESLLTLPNLEEGHYRLTAQLLDGSLPIGEPVVTNFAIEPPWYRSTLAYVSYWGTGLFLGLAIIAFGHTRAKRKHDYLETLVRERTDELRATMDKLTEEARTSATLAERNRLAGEIHDSLQQGLSGLALQLDATLRLDQLDPNLRSKLAVARRMVTFTRQEVQQAVWDLESPLLQNDDLVEALRNMAALLNDGPTHIEIESDGPFPKIPSRTQHHVLRIAQEAITNAIRHSEAERIDVRLSRNGATASIAITDNGKGFDTSKALADGLGHFGIRGLRARASKIGGDLRIDSALGSGTSVRLTVPLPEPTDDPSPSNARTQD